MTRAEDPKQDRDLDPVEDRVRVRQARESVQDAIGKIIGEPLGEKPDGEDRDGDDKGGDQGSGAEKPVPAPPQRDRRIDKDGTD